MRTKEDIGATVQPDFAFSFFLFSLAKAEKIVMDNGGEKVPPPASFFFPPLFGGRICDRPTPLAFLFFLSFPLHFDRKDGQYLFGASYG